MNRLTRVSAMLFVALAGFLTGAAGPAPGGYDPLAMKEQVLTPPIDVTVSDIARQRDIPLRLYLPDEKSPRPVILFSHGLGGSREGYAYLGRHWAARGYVVVCLQHPGSDDSVWRDAPPLQRLNAMRQAASVQNTLLRFGDVPAVIDELERWNKLADHALAGRLDLSHIGMCGHSFGAVTTQGVSGQRFAAGLSFTDKRIKAAIALSPSAARRGDAKQAFGQVAIPWMLMTGTLDTSIIGEANVESRLTVFPALPAGNKYELVLDKAEHSAFSDRALPGDREKRNANHHRAILGLGTAFWDAFLREDAAASEWLNGDGPRGILEKGDRWQRK